MCPGVLREPPARTSNQTTEQKQHQLNLERTASYAGPQAFINRAVANKSGMLSPLQVYANHTVEQIKT